MSRAPLPPPRPRGGDRRAARRRVAHDAAPARQAPLPSGHRDDGGADDGPEGDVPMISRLRAAWPLFCWVVYLQGFGRCK